MTISEWRQDKAKVHEASKLLDSPLFKEMLDTIKRSHEFGHGKPKTGVTDGDRSYLLGVVDGYHYAMTALEDLGKLLPRKTELAQDYKGQ